MAFRLQISWEPQQAVSGNLEYLRFVEIVRSEQDL